MSIPEYDQWAEGCTDTSSTYEDPSTYKENKCNVHSKRENAANPNYEYERFEVNNLPAHKSTSIQTDGIDANALQKVLRPPPGLEFLCFVISPMPRIELASFDTACITLPPLAQIV
ncbi:hypothetical protein GWI33_002366 [Rhynchophorus ferrugineus]|uniref:Uncharacterized protein n=1 Tax=Rhynchophorus ferrugineus TaxID=354439 RepID=A0A834IN09_RHYFE|nr:hypothetical protein GWI33_002366 [Rhynchophorus ferrugineus]